jgi:GST-like protein
MIRLYTWKTPNGRKASIMLEECGLAYEPHPVNIGKNEQFDPAFLAVNPNNKIPALVDTDGPDGREIAIFESGAILLYLAEKTGRFLSKDALARYEAIQWLMWQMGGLGPMMGQAYHFRHAAPETVDYAVKRYTDETNRLFRVMDGRLRDREYLAGDYSIADIACYPWADRWQPIGGVDIGEYPNVRRWLQAVAARPAVQRGMSVP